MKKAVFIAAAILGLFACSNQNKSDVQTQKVDSTVTRTTKNMKNLISIVEIPVSNFSRSVTFYQAILGVDIEKMEMDGVQLGVFPSDEKTVNVVLAKGKDYKPTADGAVLYLNVGDNLQAVLNKVESNGGKIISLKTEISPEMGFFALFIDTEGNKLGLHSGH